EVVLLLQMQGVHVGAQTDRLLAGPLALQGADHAGLAQPAMDLDAPRSEPVGDDLGGPLLLEGGLGMAMDIAADGGEIGLLGGQEMGCKAGHRGPSVPPESSREGGVRQRAALNPRPPCFFSPPSTSRTASACACCAATWPVPRCSTTARRPRPKRSPTPAANGCTWSISTARSKVIRSIAPPCRASSRRLPCRPSWAAAFAPSKASPSGSRPAS